MIWRRRRRTDKDEASRFKLRDNDEVEADIRRALEDNAERRGKIEAEARTGDEMVEEALEGETRRRERRHGSGWRRRLWRRRPRRPNGGRSRRT